MEKIIKLNENTEIIIDKKVEIGSRVVLGRNCKKINIGYGSIVGNDVYIDVPQLSVGEYTTIHKNITIHGYKSCTIGHNCWIGQNTIIDSIGGTIIGNNVGIGAYSQLWSHIKFGDALDGCRWNSTNQLIIENDVWFVGHCIVSPIIAKRKSMLMVGGVITKDMEENHIYGGSPAKDLTEKLGTQFEVITVDEKEERFKALYRSFLREQNINSNDFTINIISDLDREYVLENKKNTTFFLKQRRYIPIRSDIEFRFMRYLLYDKAKFVPVIESRN